MGILEGLLREGLGGRCRVCVLAGDINVLHRVFYARVMNTSKKQWRPSWHPDSALELGGAGECSAHGCRIARAFASCMPASLYFSAHFLSSCLRAAFYRNAGLRALRLHVGLQVRHILFYGMSRAMQIIRCFLRACRFQARNLRI